MKNIQKKLMILLFIALAFPQLGYSQDNLANELTYEVNRVYPYISMTKEKVKEAYAIADFKDETSGLNLDYNPSWVRTYISVEVLAQHKGELNKAIHKNNILSQEQKDLIHMADVGTDIAVKVHYIPENTLSHNDAKELHFTFSVSPENEATYPGGKQQLRKYLKDKAIDKIPSNSFKNYDLTTVKFTVNEEGDITNVHIFAAEYNTSPNEAINNLLLETIRNMPRWKPATYADGTTVAQEFVLTVGNMENCVIHMLNIQKK